MRQKVVYLVVFMLVVANVGVWNQITGQGEGKIVFLDVGQGDSIYIQTEKGHRILVDGGPDAKVLERLSMYIPFWDKEIDLIVLTHPDADHVSGLVDVLERYKVGHILWTGVRAESHVFEAWVNAIEEEGAIITHAEKGQRIMWNDTSFIKVLHPGDIEAIDVVNDTSVVLQVISPENKILLTGDITRKVEQELVDMDIRSDILKIGHHGSKTSTSALFVEAVQPEYAVIQAGKDNQFSHPHSIVLETLSDYGITIERTDLNGNVEFSF